MAESTSVALMAAPIPTSAQMKRAERFVRERFLHDGEDPALALGPSSPRRRALDQALVELEAGAKRPSTDWRRRYSLMLGLERLLSDDEPKLADGTVLSAHQVDALSGTLAALLADAQRTDGGEDHPEGEAGQSFAAARRATEGDWGDEARAHPGPEQPDHGRAGGDEGRGCDEEEEVVEDVGEHGGRERDDDSGEEEEEADEEDEGEEADEEDEGEEADEEDEGEEEEEADEEDEGEEEEEEEEEEDSEPQDWVEEGGAQDGEVVPLEDPNAHKRFWFEHATGAGKTVAALGFVEASQTGGVLILTHRRNLVDQFVGELRDRGYAKRISRPLYLGEDDANGPVTVETYQWFVRNAGRISSAYTIVICDEAHTALGEKTSAAIRAWTGPIFIGMTATGALIARHVTDLFPTQTSRFDLAQAARRGVIVPLRCVRIPPGVGVRTIAKVPLRRGEVDTEFDQEELAQLLDQQPFNLAAANLYKTRFNGIPGVVYAAGVKHAYNLAEAFRAEGIKAQAVSGETPKRELAEILASYEKGDIDVLINAQLLAEGWNSPRATLCMHLAPTASRRIYQQRVGRVTRKHPGKEAGIVVDFVHPATKNDDPVVTLHSLLDRDVYRGGAIVVGPVRRGRGRRMRVERRVLPVCAEEERRFQVFERELWRIAVENLDYGEQHVWAALAGARVQPGGWRKARAMLHFDRTGELKMRFLINAVQRNKSAQLRLRALTDIAALKDPDAFDTAIDIVGSWGREERREAVKVLLRALAERRVGRRDQANAWIWRLAEYSREVHEEYAVQRWPETKRLLGLLVNSAGAAHARNARRLVQASRKQDRRLAAALLAAALAHTPEAEEVLRGARMRMSRKPQALARELLRNFPKRRARNGRRRHRLQAPDAEQQQIAPGNDIGVDHRGEGEERGEAEELQLESGREAPLNGLLSRNGDAPDEPSASLQRPSSGVSANGNAKTADPKTAKATTAKAKDADAKTAKAKVAAKKSEDAADEVKTAAKEAKTAPKKRTASKLAKAASEEAQAAATEAKTAPKKRTTRKPDVQPALQASSAAVES